MLALSINNPIVEQYFHHDPKEASDFLEAVAMEKIVLVTINKETKSEKQLDKLTSILNKSKGIVVFKNIKDSTEWQKQVRNEW